MSGFSHVPVLLNETLEHLSIKPDGIYADGTAGGGGHSFAIGSALSEKGLLICTDRDTEAVEACRIRLEPLKCKKEIIHSEFRNLPEILENKGLKLDGLLLDLGVSSHQLDSAERGFSYMHDAPLDMRMNRDDAFTAADLINTYPENELARIFFEYGEERWSRQIAKKIVSKREEKPFETTYELVDAIRSAMPKKALGESQHPAKRVFQAIRIAVNGELSQIRDILSDIIPHMNHGGRICVITFHSLEDRIVKTSFSTAENPCTCPPDFPVCVCGKKVSAKLLQENP
jgi:16S rRNA (cytosine1402-N4)-methyltransferase